jgi:hypothetical protein
MTLTPDDLTTRLRTLPLRLRMLTGPEASQPLAPVMGVSARSLFEMAEELDHALPALLDATDTLARVREWAEKWAAADYPAGPDPWKFAAEEVLAIISTR